MTRKQAHRYLIDRLSKYIANFTDIGCFVECGVKQGTASAIMARNLKQKGFLFDTWRGFPSFSEVDAPTSSRRKRIKKRMHGKSIKKDCVKNLKDHGVYDQCTLIEGDICKTVPEFIKDAAVIISMLHVDTDVYEPARVSLYSLWPFIHANGAVLLHDYSDKRWPGIKKLVDDFIKENNVDLYVPPVDKLHAAVLLNKDRKLKEFLSNLDYNG